MTRSGWTDKTGINVTPAVKYKQIQSNVTYPAFFLSQSNSLHTPVHLKPFDRQLQVESWYDLVHEQDNGSNRTVRTGSRRQSYHSLRAIILWRVDILVASTWIVGRYSTVSWRTSTWRPTKIFIWKQSVHLLSAWRLHVVALRPTKRF